jgi:hypothetical protein
VAQQDKVFELRDGRKVFVQASETLEGTSSDGRKFAYGLKVS